MGELAILFILLLLGKKGKAMTTKAPIPFARAWRERTTALMARAKGGARWGPRLAKRLGSDAAGAAAARWIGIESGGNPLTSSKLNERGLTQVMKGSLAELGLTEADYAVMADPKTTDDQHADLAAIVIKSEARRVASGGKSPAPGWGPSVNGVGIGAAKLRHGLPLLIVELRNAGHWKSQLTATMQSALGRLVGDDGQRSKPFVPSAKLASYAGKAHALTGDPTQDLLIRFFGSAAIVAFAEEAIGFGDVIMPPSNKVS